MKLQDVGQARVVQELLGGDVGSLGGVKSGREIQQ